MENFYSWAKGDKESSLAKFVSDNSHELKNKFVKEVFNSNQEHCMEEVARLEGVGYINNSYATNFNSAWYALSLMNGPFVWIAGGLKRDLESLNGEKKRMDYEIFKDFDFENTKGIIYLASGNNEEFYKKIGRKVGFYYNTNSMKEAVEVARLNSKRGYTILLNPGFSSLDLFESYAEKGNAFSKIVGEY